MVEDMVRSYSTIFKNDAHTRNLAYKAVRSAKRTDASSSANSYDNTHCDIAYEDEFVDWDEIREAENWGEFILNSSYNPDQVYLGVGNPDQSRYDTNNKLNSCNNSNSSSSSVNVVKINESEFKATGDKLYEFLISGSTFSDPQ
jgi:hypothetical protein